MRQPIPGATVVTICYNNLDNSHFKAIDPGEYCKISFKDSAKKVDRETIG